MRSVFRSSIALAIALGAGATADAQNIINQDELDLVGRTNLFVGAGARAYGMAGAFLARADDATAASWNPAGLSYLRRPEVTIVGSRNVFNNDLNLDRTEASRFKGNALDFGAFTYPLQFRGLSGAAQISYQRAIPFSGSRVLRRDGVEIIAIEASGGFDVIALGTGWRVSRRWRIGATLNRWFNGYRQEQFRSPESFRSRQLDSDFRLEGWSTNLGLMWSPFESLNVGVVGKTGFTADVRLAKRRTDTVTGPDGDVLRVTTNAHESDDVRLDFPGGVGAGLSWRPRSQITVSADYSRTFWSDARIHNFFALPFAPGRVPEPPVVFSSLIYPNLTENKETQVDSEQIRFGVEYVLLFGRLKFPLRGGYFNDRQIVRDIDGRPPRFNGVTLGTGIIVGPILVDVAYVHESGAYVATDGGRNSFRSQRFFASLIYRYRGLP